VYLLIQRIDLLILDCIDNPTKDYKELAGNFYAQ